MSTLQAANILNRAFSFVEPEIVVMLKTSNNNVAIVNRWLKELAFFLHYETI